MNQSDREKPNNTEQRLVGETNQKENSITTLLPSAVSSQTTKLINSMSSKNLNNRNLNPRTTCKTPNLLFFLPFARQPNREIRDQRKRNRGNLVEIRDLDCWMNNLRYWMNKSSWGLTKDGEKWKIR